MVGILLKYVVGFARLRYSQPTAQVGREQPLKESSLKAKEEGCILNFYRASYGLCSS